MDLIVIYLFYVDNEQKGFKKQCIYNATEFIFHTEKTRLSFENQKVTGCMLL